MSYSINRVQMELESLGYLTTATDGPQGRMVCFDYKIETGSHQGEEIKVGVSFQEEGYPEYPPHWVHVTPPIPDGKAGVVQKYHLNGHEWIAMSRPPGDLWDRLRTKHMAAYISEHLRRLWKDT